MYTQYTNINYVFYNILDCKGVVPSDMYSYYYRTPLSRRVNSVLFLPTSGIFLKLCMFCNNYNSTSNFWYVNSWYEREITEFYNIKFMYSVDNRCLLLPYSYFNNNSICVTNSNSLYAVKYSLVDRDVRSIIRNDVLL